MIGSLILLCATLVLMLVSASGGLAGEPAAIRPGEPAPFAGILLSPDDAKALQRDRAALKAAQERAKLLEERVQGLEEIDRAQEARVKALEGMIAGLEQQVALLERQAALYRDALTLSREVLATVEQSSRLTREEVDRLRARVVELESERGRRRFVDYLRDGGLLLLGVLLGRGLAF